MEAVVGLVVAGAATLVIVVGWPVVLWVAIAGIASAWLTTVARRQEARSPIRARVARGARDSALCLTVGLSLVLLSQLLLRTSSILVGEETVRDAEEFIIGARDFLSLATNLGVAASIGVLILVLLLAHGSPAWRPVRKLASCRKAISYGWLTLAAATSFTFFAGARVAQTEGHWVEAHRKEYVAALRDVHEQSDRLIALAAVMEKVEKITDDERGAIVENITIACGGSSADSRLRDFAKDAVRLFPRPVNAPGVTRHSIAPPVRSPAAARSLSLPGDSRHVRHISEERKAAIWSWSGGNSSNVELSPIGDSGPSIGSEMQPRPRKSELEQIQDEAAYFHQLAEEREEAIVQVLTAALGTAIPNGSHHLVRGFLDNIVGEFVGGVIAELGAEEVVARLMGRSNSGDGSRSSSAFIWSWPKQRERAESHQAGASDSKGDHAVAHDIAPSRSVSQSVPSSLSSSSSGSSSSRTLDDLSELSLGTTIKPIDFKPFGLKPIDFKPLDTRPPYGGLPPRGINPLGRRPVDLGTPIRTGMRPPGLRPGQQYRPPGYRPGPRPRH